MTTARRSALTDTVRAQLRDAPGAVMVDGPDGPFWALLDDYDQEQHGEVPHFLEFHRATWLQRRKVLTMATDDVGSLVDDEGQVVDDVTVDIEDVTFLVRDLRRKDDGLITMAFLVEDDA